MILVAALLLLGAADQPQRIPAEAATIVHVYPHDKTAFTEGLFFRDGYLYESTGQVGHSSIRKVALDTGRIVREVTVPAPYFGEGIIAWGKQIISLTWQHQTGFRWSLDGFKKLGSFHYPGEGWALTSDGKAIIMSDGTPELRFLDPVTLREQRRLQVTINGRPVTQINELEFVDGEILANIWQTNFIVRIDPASGHVVGVIDLTALTRSVNPTDSNAVPNGIAWDAARRRLFVSGKLWPVLFEITPPKGGQSIPAQR
ncbi:glutaminyl-peptide cyclotransferase [Sphingomonas sp. 28-63-12]|uniref:glutaminyl-peptide cyclotransferase n=1 Tax=Sphingomonas sp. 28-63-12 TaxID=1970434 RepID=UPI0035A8DD52